MVIKAIEILTNDIEGCEHFYRMVLGFPLLYKTIDTISFSAGQSILSFKLVSGVRPCYHFAFGIPSNKVEEAYAYITSKTVVLPFTPSVFIAEFSNWNAHAFYFYDNQQNIVEFIAHHDLPNSITNPFSSSSVIGICEIGIPVDDVQQLCQQLNNKTLIPYYVKGPKLVDFCAMGDEHGLFIVTKIGRGWLPTQQPAQRYWTTVIFENNGVEKKYIVI